MFRLIRSLAKSMLIALFVACAVPSFAQTGAQPGGQAGAQPEQPMPKYKEPVRRDYEMGNTKGNIYMGRDSQGDSVVEIGPKPKKPDQQQQNTGIGPILVVPQIGGRR